MATTQMSERFCAPDADVTVSSSDGVIFKLHRKHLEVHSDVFADAASATLPENGKDEVVQLSETSAVLEVLFQYMYRQPQPNLQLVEFATFAGVAEAAEKYVVYAALPAVMIRMTAWTIQHPLEVLDYAARHSHKQLANEAARVAIGRPLTEAVSILAHDTLIKWVAFHHTWHENARNLLSFYIVNHQYFPQKMPDLAACVKNPYMCYSYRTNLESMAIGTAEQIAWAKNALKAFLDRKFMA
ncbi:hypothetical protein DFH06DRAFT_1300846 [Mycena polygramma]|nr:hypothetical protein DFH06DRAFT_1300846 [Mycena polygramma]